MYNNSVMVDEKYKEIEGLRPLIRKLSLQFLGQFSGGAFPQNEALDDLMQEGVLGALTAYDRFDPTVGVKFSSYAYMYIFGALQAHTALIFGVCKQPRRNISNQYRGLGLREVSEDDVADNVMDICDDFLQYEDKLGFIAHVFKEDLTKNEQLCVYKRFLNNSIQLPDRINAMYDFFVESGLLKLRRILDHLNFEV